MERRHYRGIRPSHRVASSGPGPGAPEAPIPFPPTPATKHAFEGDRRGMRECLRREATQARIIQAELSAEGVPLAERVAALQLPWLESLFHTPERVERLLHTDRLAVPATRLLESLRASGPEQAIRSEVMLMEAIQQHLGITRLFASGTHGQHLRLSRLRQARRCEALQRMLSLWEATLRAT